MIISPHSDRTGRGDGPVDGSVASAIGALLATQASAFADAWGRRPLLTQPGRPERFADLLSADAVDELVSERGLRTPFLRVAKNGSTLANTAFTAGGGVGAGVADQVSDDRLVALFAEGSTLVLQALHRVWPPVIELCGRLAAELRHPVQANAYVTPPQNQGFDDHYDVHDVFVLQIAGEKHWSIHEPVLTAPLRDQPWSDRREDVRRAAAAQPVIDTVLTPGDCLYLPRGYLHAAKALGGVSIHLTIGIHAWTRYTLAEQITQTVLAQVREDEELRRSLPLGADLGEPTSVADEIDLVAKRLADAVAAVQPEMITDGLRRRSREASRAAPVGPLRQLADATSLTERTVVRLRDHLDLRVRERADGGVELVSRAGVTMITADERSAAATLWDGGSMTAGAAGLELVRRLLLAGLVVAEPEPTQ